MKLKVSLKDARNPLGTIEEARQKALFCREKRKPRLYAAYVKKLDSLMQTSIKIED